MQRRDFLKGTLAVAALKEILGSRWDKLQDELAAQQQVKPSKSPN